MLQLLLISFIAGMLTVLAPCILPLLPIIVGGSVSGHATSRRATVIVASLGVSVFLFTLLLKATTAFIAIPALFWQLLSGGLLVFFGIVTIVPSLWDRIPFVSALYISSNKLLGSGYKKQSIWGDAIIGAALGPVFSSCSPTYFVILAAVLPAHFATGIVYLLAYVLGLCLFLFVVAYVGQRAIAYLGVASNPEGWFKKAIGLLFVLIGIAVIFGIDKKIEAALPSGAFGEIGVEQQLLSSLQSHGMPEATMPAGGALTLAQKDAVYSKAPELVTPDGYINTGDAPISLAQYRGKNVVLVDFWDYSCINCQRTFPYLTAWYQKYKDQGLVIVGVHTPEFAFEQVKANVEDAAQRFGLTYPIVLDNHYQTWQAFQNQFWPREYLIDIDGYIVHDHAGEGEYDKTELAITQALAERATRLGTSPLTATSTVNVAASVTPGDVRSPETYFGADRNQYLGNGIPGVVGIQKFVVPSSLDPNALYLGGSWNILREYAEAKAGSSVLFTYGAHDLYFVATNPSEPATIQVLRDGKPLGIFAGNDVDPKTSEATISGDRLYRLIHDPSAGVHTIEIRVLKGTLDAYTFTFG